MGFEERHGDIPLEYGASKERWRLDAELSGLSHKRRRRRLEKALIIDDSPLVK